MQLFTNLAHAVTMYLALASLLRWKHLRDNGSIRLNRSLRAYVVLTQSVH